MSATLTIDRDSAPGSWATAIAHTPHLAAQDHEITRGDSPSNTARAGEAGSLTPGFVSPGNHGRAS